MGATEEGLSFQKGPGQLPVGTRTRPNVSNPEELQDNRGENSKA